MRPARLQFRPRDHRRKHRRQVRNGGGGMPPFADVLSDEEIDAVAQYVVEEIAPKQ